jgi:hypothetical protein
MAADVTKIHLGAGEIFVTSDLTAAPTSGVDKTDPTSSGLMAMASNFTAPSTSASPTWRNPGFTQGPATLIYRPTYYQVVTEQAFAEVITTPTAEESSLNFVMLEADYRNFAFQMGQGTTHVVTGPPVQNAIHVGGKATVTCSVVVMCSRKRSGVGYHLLTLYQAYSNEGSTSNFERRAELRLPVVARTLADATRPVGDQLFQLIEYPANPA